MTTQPDPTNGWGWSDRREIDNRLIIAEQHLNDLTNRLDRLLSVSEYNADKRTSEVITHTLQDKLAELEVKVREFVKEQRELVIAIRREIAQGDENLHQEILQEAASRRKQQEEEHKARQSQMRFLVSVILVPTVLAVVQLLMSHR